MRSLIVLSALVSLCVAISTYQGTITFEYDTDFSIVLQQPNSSIVVGIFNYEANYDDTVNSDSTYLPAIASIDTSNGTLRFAYYYNTSFSIYGGLVDVNGNIVTVGYANLDNTDEEYYNVVVAKFGSDGSLLWINEYNSSVLSYPGEYDGIASIAATTDGGYFVAAGYSVAKLYGNGSVAWSKGYNPDESDDLFYGAAVSTDGYFAIGYSEANDGSVIIFKLAENGTLLWEQIYGGSENDEIFPGTTYAVLSNGNLVVAAYLENSQSEFGGDDLAILQVNGASGNVVSYVTYNNGNDFDDWEFDTYALTIDGNGNTVVAGYADGESIISLSPSGAVNWAYNFDNVDDDYFTSLLSQPNGALFALSSDTDDNGISQVTFLTIDVSGRGCSERESYALNSTVNDAAASNYAWNFTNAGWFATSWNITAKTAFLPTIALNCNSTFSTSGVSSSGVSTASSTGVTGTGTGTGTGSSTESSTTGSPAGVLALGWAAFVGAFLALIFVSF